MQNKDIEEVKRQHINTAKRMIQVSIFEVQCKEISATWSDMETPGSLVR